MKQVFVFSCSVQSKGGYLRTWLCPKSQFPVRETAYSSELDSDSNRSKASIPGRVPAGRSRLFEYFPNHFDSFLISATKETLKQLKLTNLDSQEE